MEMHGNPYLPEEEQAADATAVGYLNEAEAASCRSLAGPAGRALRAPDETPWVPWLHAHPVSAERVEALAGAVPAASPANPGAVASAHRGLRPWTVGAAMLV